jgi:hypothetical protein
VQDRLQSAGPYNVGGVDRRQGLAGRGPPSIAGQLTDGACGGAVHRSRDLVPRYVAAAQYSTEATAVLGFSGVPSIAGEVDTAAERKRVIDDRDFLARDGAGRMCAVDGELQPVAAQPLNRATGVTLPQRPSNAGSKRTFDRNG